MPFKTPPKYYAAWRAMKGRCYNSRHKSFADYGGRGITVCARWLHSYANFESDMGPRPPGHSLDRIDNDASYSPENCRWSDRRTQQRNRRVTVRLVIEGRSYLAVDLSDRSDLKRDTIIHRAKQGLPMDEVMSPERRVYHPGLALGGAANGKRQNARTHCANGHAFSQENTSYSKEGWRRCRACHRNAETRRRERRRASS